MPSQVSDQELADAILQSVESNSFPQSEHVASAPVPPTSLPKLLEVLDRATEDLRNEVRGTSREAADDVDGWIEQAQKLQIDIQHSQETAKSIVQEAEAAKQDTAQVQDAAAKVSFLHSEIAYNESLARVLEQLQDISSLLESAQDAAVRGNVMYSLERLEDAEKAIQGLGPFESTRPAGLVKSRTEQLKRDVVETLTDSWNGLIVVDASTRTITCKDEIPSAIPDVQRADPTSGDATLNIKTIVEAVSKVGVLDDFITRLSKDMDKIIVSPRLVIRKDKSVSGFDIKGDDIRSTSQVRDLSIKATLGDLEVLAEYLSTRLPPSIATPLSEKLIPVIASRLISHWLLPAVPVSTSGVPAFQETLSHVLGLAAYLDELEWQGQDRLREWVDQSAEIWLARRKQHGIAKVQYLFPRRVQEKKKVERVETQVLHKGDAMLAGQEEQDDDWGAEWGEDAQPAEEEKKAPKADIEEEDMAAWGLDDDEPQPDSQKDTKAAPNQEEDEEDWGAEWGDDEDAQPAQPESASKSPEHPKQNSKMAAPSQPTQPTADQEVTLRETYTVTAIPDSIIEVILQAVTDIHALNSPKLASSVITPASGGLYILPSLLLAMYRATASTHYERHDAGNMLIYNDCIRLSDRLRTFLQEQEEKDASLKLPHHLRASVRLRPKLEHDIKQIEGFGKRAYGREMESQRQIIRDHLDDAQGFQGCTKAPFATVCDNAIATTIDRIAEVKRQWQAVLSPSALLQSLGSLVSTAFAKFIADVEDMPDIAEDESKKLHSYCVSLSSLSSHFQTDNGTGEMRDMTSVYTPNWFKFQYLGEILDSSLADIKYFWTDGELKLEMDAEEVVDLIKALFAESDYRRKAVAEIRRVSRG